MRKSLFSSFSFWLFAGLAIVAMLPAIPIWTSLILGVLFAFIAPKGAGFNTTPFTKYSLQIAIVLIALSMPVTQVFETGFSGIAFIFLFVIATALLGFLMYKFFSMQKQEAELMTAGSAICGGTAVATISPLIHASKSSTSIILGSIYILNALALLIYPFIGQWIGLSDTQFGIWAAVAVHDTASVIGTAQSFSPQAAETATIYKLIRTLFLFPAIFIFSMLYKQKGNKAEIPWFVILFALVLALQFVVEIPENVTQQSSFISRRLLQFSIFTIGTGLPLEKIKTLKGKSVFLTVLLWLILSIVSLFAVYFLF